ncbi:hypothetical protein LIER_03444 [Lithospermum erythrorhizon]|uniref:Reverse transcriptase zinc-binding domain-containing protein n=1 Tax=Lithospermum erythrorhizon TaxID=34254 RepID=A0AAV3NX31_LITER
MLQLRHMVRPHVNREVKNGRDTNCLFDNWHEAGQVPRFGFVEWLACLNRLPTKNRLQSWNIAVDEKCVFCHDRVNRDHLFFECSFSATILRKLLLYLKEHHPPQP